MDKWQSRNISEKGNKWSPFLPGSTFWTAVQGRGNLRREQWSFWVEKRDQKTGRLRQLESVGRALERREICRERAREICRAESVAKAMVHIHMVKLHKVGQ